MGERLFVKELANGLVLLGQPMEHVASAAVTVMSPSGSSYDPAPSAGAAAVGAEWLLRGAGDRDSRQLNDALDALGCQHHQGVQSEHIQFGSAQLGRNLADALAIIADVFQRGRLEDDTFEPCRDLTIQDLASLEDEPSQKCLAMLREKFFPYPLGRNMYGTMETLKAMTTADVRSHLKSHLTPQGTMLSVAGAFDWPALCELAERLFGDWRAPAAAPVKVTPAEGGVTFVEKDSAQQYITLASPSITMKDKQYIAARMAEMVLSGGMSGRLFTEVREKRGLVYSVAAGHHSLKNCAGMFTFAGTTPPKAQQTFDVVMGELRRLVEGIGEDEMARARTQLKSALIMQGQSTSARSNALANDYYHLGRLRTLEEIATAIDRVTVPEVLDYLRAYPLQNVTILIIGPEPIKANV